MNVSSCKKGTPEGFLRNLHCVRNVQDIEGLSSRRNDHENAEILVNAGVSAVKGKASGRHSEVSLLRIQDQLASVGIRLHKAPGTIISQMDSQRMWLQEGCRCK